MGWGPSKLKGWGPKSSACPSKARETKLFGRDIPGFCWDVSGAPEKFEEKMFVFNFGPLLECLFYAMSCDYSLLIAVNCY